MEIKWEITAYLFCSWIYCRAKGNGSCSTMQKRCLRGRFVRKFHNSNAHFIWFVSHFTVGVRGYYYCIAFHCWLSINGTVISFRERERERKETRNEINLRADLSRGPSITSLSSYGAKVRAGAKKMEGGRGVEKRKRLPANPMILVNAPWYFTVCQISNKQKVDKSLVRGRFS